MLHRGGLRALGRCLGSLQAGKMSISKNASKECRFIYFPSFRRTLDTRYMYYSTLREMKRFYKSAGIEESEDGYQITVDNRKVKTPGGKLLVVPKKQLAMAMASEWNMQTGTIKTHSMHLTGLSNIVIDKPNVRTSEKRIGDILEFLYTDTVCFPTSEPDDLVNLQQREWDPVISWFCKRFDVSLVSGDNLLVHVPTIPQDSVQKLTSHLMEINYWAMAGLEYAVETSKSFIITMALLDNHVNVERAAYLTRLELEFQIGRWGSVEWAHDVDLMELRCRLAASALFYHLNTCG